jgi:hypothetical protein
MDDFTKIPGADVALLFVKLRGELDESFFESDFPYTRYSERDWDTKTSSLQPSEPRFTTYLDCSDWFYWGTSDSEELTAENFHLLEETISELMPLYEEAEKEWRAASDEWSARNTEAYKKWSDGYGRPKKRSGKQVWKPIEGQPEMTHTKIARHAERLFCAKVRNMRPQGAAYKYIPEVVKPLYDRAGEPRKIDFFNPRTQSTDQYEYRPNEFNDPSDLGEIG